MSYNPTFWKKGDVISSDRLNKIEQAIDDVGNSVLPPVTAEDEGKVLAVVNGVWDKGEASGGADWEAKEGEDGYIANKPFYDGRELKKLCEFDVTFPDDTNYIYFDQSIHVDEPFDIDNTYVLIVNDSNVLDASFSTYEGDGNVASEMFNIHTGGTEEIINVAKALPTIASGDYNIKIFRPISGELKKINKIFIPDEVILKNIKDAENGGVIEGHYTVASGNYAHAEGTGTTASGTGSHAEGFETTASSYYSHAEGNETTASGNGSHAEGGGTLASGGPSHAEGGYTTASGYCSHAEGNYTTASAETSHAEGSHTTASGVASHAEGANGYASGSGAHTEGGYGISTFNILLSGDANATTYTVFRDGSSANTPTIPTLVGRTLKNRQSRVISETKDGDRVATITVDKTLSSKAVTKTRYAVDTGCVASESNSHAEGAYSVASANAAHAEGTLAFASGSNSHAEGNYTIASGNGSHAEGYHTTSSGNSSHAEGGYTQTQLIVKLSGAANATTYTIASSEENLPTLVGWTIQGDKKIISETTNNGVVKTITLNETLSSTAVTNAMYAIDMGCMASGQSSHAEGAFSNAKGAYSHAEGDGTLASGPYSHSEGRRTTASGARSHAEGKKSVASGSTSHAEGSYTTASGQYSHAEGSGSVASGGVSHAEGWTAVASGDGSHAEGNETTASGRGSHAEGDCTIASGENSHAEGYFTTANHKCQHVFGEYNIEDASSDYATVRGNYVEIVGNGTSSNAKSNARTLDWNGNEVLAGKLTVGANPTDNMDVVTKGYMDARIPVPPTTNGTYSLKVTISDGTAAYSWVAE